MLPTQNQKLLTALLFCILISLVSFAQQPISVQGKVTNEKGEPIQNASVSVSGSEKGTLTNTGGEFKINAPANGKLVISYIGYEKTTVDVGAFHFRSIKTFVHYLK